MQLQVTLLFVGVVSKWRTFGEVVQDEDGTAGKPNFTMPKYSDEYHHSIHMPADLKCDACNIVAFQITRVLSTAQVKHGSADRLPDSAMLLLFEDACSQKSYLMYGVKEVGNETRLAGPGMDTMKAPGATYGLGHWPGRLYRMCNMYIEEFDEEGIYSVFLKSPRSLQDFLCKNPARAGLTDVCLPQKGTEDKTEDTTRKNKKVREDL